jgi:predicted dehydrogenase
MDRLRLAVIGVGHLGQSHAKILASLPDVELVGVVDVNPRQAQTVAEKYGTQVFDNPEELLGKVDAVSVVVPTTYHHRVAKRFLESGVPVLVEKPITLTVQEADELVQIANARSLPFQVGHIERFNPAFEAIASRPLQPKFIECERHGPFTGRSMDIGVVLDLMIHDLDLLLDLNRCHVREVEALGTTIFGGHEDIVNARLTFANGCIAHVTASRVSPTPKRRMRVWASEGYLAADFMTKKLTMQQPTESLRRHGLQLSRLSDGERTRLKDELFTRYVQTCEVDCTRKTDQLTQELLDFTQSVRDRKSPRVTGEDGRAALALAERILESVRSHRWSGGLNGKVGPEEWPEPLGKLFEIEERRAA